MKIEFDPISRAMRFLKFFILGLIASIFIERVIGYFLYSHFRINILNYFWWIRYYVESTLGIDQTEPHFWHYFFVDLIEWKNSLALALMLILSIALGLAADWFFLWYQRTHMQGGAKK